MANGFNVFPLVLSIREDGSLEATVRNAEAFLGGAAKRAGASWEAAGQKADGAFRLDNARRQVQQFAREVDAFRNRQASQRTDILGIQQSLAALGSNPFQKIANEQLRAENAIDQQRQRAHADRMAAISREFDAAMSGIRAQQAAQTAAFKQAESEGNRLIALDRQRVAESAKLVAGPQFIQSVAFDPAGAQAAAASARAFAQQQIALADAAERSALSIGKATAADRAFAVSAREAANAATVEADRLEAVAATQQRVAASAAAAGTKLAASGDVVANSMRGQRFSTIQASQQFQDFFIQIQGGQNPLVAFSQQASQLAFVMAGAGGAAGSFARFISGGWGSLIFGGVAVLSIFTSKLFENKDAATEAEKAAKAFGDRQADIKNFIDQVTGALIEQNQTLVQNAILTRQARIDANKEKVREGRDEAFSAARQARIINPTNEELLGAERGGGVARARIDPAITKAIRDAAGDVAKLDANLQSLAKTRPELKNLITDTSTAAGQAVLLARENKDLQKEIAALQGNKSAVFNDPSAVSNLVAIAAATNQYTKRIAELNEQQRILDQNVRNKTFKGTREEYIAQSADIKKQIEAQEKAKSDAAKAERSSQSAAKRAAGNRREELFADAKAIADGTNAIKSANSEYAAEITRLKNQLQEGLISPAAAKASAIAAREIRNAAVEAAQAGSKLDEALQRIGQEFDGDSRFVNRIDKARQAIADARKQLGELGTAVIGENTYDQDGLDKLAAGIEAAYVRPITDANRELQEQAQIQAAILAGREDEADFLQLKFQILQSYGDLTDEERAALEAQLEPLRDLLDLEYERNKAIELRNRIVDSQVQQARDLQAALTDALEEPFKGSSYKNLLQTITQGRKRALAEKLSVELFGDLGGDVRDKLTRGAEALSTSSSELGKSADSIRSSAEQSGDAMKTAADRHKEAAAELKDAAGALARSAASGPTVAQATTTPSAYGLGGGSSGVSADGSIIVTGNRIAQGGIGGEAIKVAIPDINAAFSGEFAAAGNALGGGGGIRALLNDDNLLTLAGSALGGKAGAAISAYQNVKVFRSLGDSIAKNVGGQLGSTLGNAFAGVGSGLFADSIVKAFGIKGSSTGAAIGGAIGNAILPGIGGFIGGALGSIVGGLFKKTPKASVQLGTDSFGNFETGATVAKGKGKGARLDAAFETADALFSALEQLGDEFGIGITAGLNLGSIGSRKKKVVFDPTGQNRTKGAGVQTFSGDDAAEQAVKAAIRNAIDKGVIQGIRESTKRLLTAGKDFDAALEKAVAFEGVFSELKSYIDPVGFALDHVDKKFNSLRRIFDEAGASAEEYAKLEQLYGIQRAEAIEQANSKILSSLQSFLKELTYKGDTGLSLRTRESNASRALNPLIGQIRAGQTVDQDAFTETAQSYLEISREIYGSTEEYFRRLREITALTAQAITNAGGQVTAITGDIAAATGTSYSSVSSAAISASTSGATVAANDNGVATSIGGALAAQTATLAQAIVAQTEALKVALKIPDDRMAMFTEAQVIKALQTAFTGLSAQSDGNGGVTFSVQPVVESVQQQTNQLIGRLDMLIASNDALRTAPSAGIVADASRVKSSAGKLLVSSLRNG